MDLLDGALVGGVTAVITWFAERFASKSRRPRGGEPLSRQHWYKADEWFSEARSYLRPPPR